MRILYLYNGNPLVMSNLDQTWGVAQGLSHYLRLIGNEVVELNFQNSNVSDQLHNEIAKKIPDVIILTEAGTIPQHVVKFWNKQNFKNILMVAEGSDEPQIMNYNLSHTLPADLIWTSDLDCVKQYNHWGKNAVWIPHWGDELIYSYHEDPCNETICTSAGPRGGMWKDATEALLKNFGQSFKAPRINGGNYISPSENNQLYVTSSINFTVSTSGDITRRLFEAAIVGRMTICDRLSNSKNLNSIFEEGKEVECYSSIDELIEKTYFYLKNHEKRKYVAENARQKCLKFHTAFARAKQLTDVFTKAIEQKIHIV